MNIEQILTANGISAISVLVILSPIIVLLFKRYESILNRVERMSLDREALIISESEKRESILKSELSELSEKSICLSNELKIINNQFIDHLQNSESEHLRILSQSHVLIEKSNQIHEKNALLMDKLLTILNYKEK